MGRFPVEGEFKPWRCGWNSSFLGTNTHSIKPVCRNCCICQFLGLHKDFKYVFWQRKIMRKVVRISTNINLWKINKSSKGRCRSWRWSWCRSMWRFIVSKLLSLSKTWSKKGKKTMLSERRTKRKSRVSSLFKKFSVTGTLWIYFRAEFFITTTISKETIFKRSETWRWCNATRSIWH